MNFNTFILAGQVELILVEELARLLNVSAFEIDRLQRECLVFSPFDDEVGRPLYPRFLTEPWLDLDDIPEITKILSPASTYQYLLTPCASLAGLTPLEVLRGESRNETESAKNILSKTLNVRRGSVYNAARRWALEVRR